MTLPRWLVGGNGPTGLAGGRLRACERAGNCLCTDAGDAPPLSYGDLDAAAVRDKLDAILADLPRVRVVERRGDYVRAEARSRVLRFVDDVEFRFDDAARVVHVRGAARVGRSDLGVNAKRIASIRQRWGRGGTTFAAVGP